MPSLRTAATAAAAVIGLVAPIVAPAAAAQAVAASGSLAITTVAGSGIAAFDGDGGLATKTALNHPRSVAAGPHGTIVIADSDNNRIRSIDSSGRITTVAGTGVAGFSGDGGPATAAQINRPYGVAADAGGSIYIADSDGHRIRKVDPSGLITTVAGTGTAGYSGDGGPATAAQLNNPRGLAVDGSGTVYIADSSNNRVRVVSPSGTITTLAGTGAAGFGGDGGPAVSALLNFPRSIAFDAAGGVYVVDTSNNRIRRIDSSGRMATVAGTGVAGFAGDGGPATAAQFNVPYGVAVDRAGNVDIADSENARVRQIRSDGSITTVAGDGVEGISGDGGPAQSAELHYPIGVAVDSGGRLFIADRDNSRVRRVSAAGPGGYYMVASDGGIFSFGNAPFAGSAGGTRLNRPVVSMAATPSGDGYWLVASDGGVFAFGDALFAGALGGTHLNAPIVGMAGTPSGRGYWLVASDGGVFAFGDALFASALGGTHLNAPIVGMAAMPDGQGYWLVGRDGGLFSFGNAQFEGSAGGRHLSAPIVGLAATPSGHGYWMATSDGGVFAFGDAPFAGSQGGRHLNAPIVRMAATPSGHGYWLVASDGGVFSSGDAAFSGSMGGGQLSAPVVSLVLAPLVRP